MGRKVRGNLCIIGGAEDRKGKKTILKTFVALAGGESAIISVMTVAALEQELIGREYCDIFLGLGVKDVHLVHIETRGDASQFGNIKSLAGSSGVFFTGGDQLRIASIMGGTPVDEELHRAYERGVIIAGTSAGASAMSDTMIVEGDGDQAPISRALSMAPGMGLLEEVVVDQHFAQRGRIGRLMLAVAQNPSVLGVGIDEDTALLVDAEARARVVGSGTVTVIDGRKLTHSNVSEQESPHPVAVLGALIHVLAPGYGFDMDTRRPLLPEAEGKRGGGIGGIDIQDQVSGGLVVYGCRRRGHGDERAPAHE